MHRSSVRSNTYIRDRRSGRTYAPQGYRQSSGLTKQLLQYLKGKFPQCNFLGFRLCVARDFYRYLSNEVEYKSKHVTRISGLKTSLLLLRSWVIKRYTS